MKLDIKNFKSRSSGFTIVELLVVIVVIGILASITIVSYTGVTQKAIAATLQSDLSNAAKQIKMFQALSPTNDLPTANNCPTPGATEICIKTSGTNALIASNGYTVNNTANPKYFSLIANNGTTTYRTTESSSPATYTSLATTDPANWIAIGNQVWAKANLNVGTRINGAVTPTNNGLGSNIEKYCYSDIEANCTSYGGLYQWNEAMNYVTAESAQGICPANSHIPTDAEWKLLEMSLGMTQTQADVVGFRGADQGTQLAPGGASGLGISLTGYRHINGLFYSDAYLWSSSEAGVNAWYRRLYSGSSTVYRNTFDKPFGFSIRCVGN